MSDSDLMIEVENLTKQYGSFTAVDNISFSCRRGEIVGLLGPNGAGKTTTMRVLTGYMPPTSGEAYIAGFDTLNDSIAARRHLGYLPESVPLYKEMTVESYLAFVGEVRRVENVWDRVDDVLEDVGLLEKAESFIGSLSKGMRQRVGLAQAIMHDPDVLILDEPTIGLDPGQIVNMRSLIRRLGEKRTILLSTHIMSEVEQICDRVIMIINGRIASDFSLASLQGDPVLAVEMATPAANAGGILQGLSGVSSVQADAGNLFHITYDGSDETRVAISNEIVRQSWGILSVTAERRSLESIFLSKLAEANASAGVGLASDTLLDGEEEE